MKSVFYVTLPLFLQYFTIINGLFSDYKSAEFFYFDANAKLHF